MNKLLIGFLLLSSWAYAGETAKYNDGQNVMYGDIVVFEDSFRGTCSGEVRELGPINLGDTDRLVSVFVSKCSTGYFDRELDVPSKNLKLKRRHKL